MALTFSSDPLLGFVNISGGRYPDEFSTLFDHGPMQQFVRDSNAMSGTAVDVKETPQDFKFVADLPGLKKEQVKVQVEPGNVLSISGERTREAKQDTDKYHRMERSTGKFLRRFQLPNNADVGKISAAADNGVLTVCVPKLPPKEPEKPKAIEVKVQ
jgi:HSP20 family protein